MALNARQRQFVAAYISCKNATRSAIAAGYSRDTAGSQGHDLLKHPEIAQRIRLGLAAQEQDLERKARCLGVTKERMIQELARTAFSNMDDFATITDKGSVKFKSTLERKPGTGHTIKKVTESTSQYGGQIGLELHSKDRAQELLCKLLGWTKEQLELSGGLSQPQVQVILTMPSNGSEKPKDEKDKK